MKIVNLEQFRALPEGTVFMKYEPCIFDELCVKGETWEYDWLYENITTQIECTGSGDFSDKLDAALETGCSVAMDFNSWGRDGCFDNDQLFAIYEKQDVTGLIEKLNHCLAMAYK